MRIVIPAVSSAAQLSGVTRHAANLVRSLLTSSEISSISLIMAEWQYESLRSIVPHDDPRLQLVSVRIGSSVLSRNLWYFETLPSFAARFDPDVIHFTYPVPLNAPAFGCSTVVSLHDLYPHDIPENFGFPKVFFNRLILRQCLGAVDAIACVSESTLQRLDMYAPLMALHKATTIYNCVETDYSQAAHGPIPNWNGEPFLLVVAQHRRNKNILLTLRVFERLLRNREIDPDTRLVIIGIEGPETAAILHHITSAGITRRVILLHGVSDPELQWCYRHSELLLAPSIIEGFGLPVAEALLNGCRVVCSDIPAFRELGGKDCHYVSLGPSAEEGFAQAICAARNEPRNPCVALPQLSAPVIAEQYLQLYQRLLASSPSSHTPEALSQGHSKKAVSATMYKPGKSVNVLGVLVEALNMEGAVGRVAEALRDQQKGYVCMVGVHGVMEARRNPDLAAIYAGALMTAPDGMPTVWVGRRHGHKQMERVPGPDLMIEIFARKEFADCTHYLYGGKEGIAEELRSELLRRFPWVRIVGTYTPPFHELSMEQEEEFIASVRELKPDIIWVGIGAPKQERFMAKYLSKLDTTLMFGVGAAFDYHTGRIHDCADWIKRAGLQWLDRLIQDPRHLWWRYLRNNPAFLWHIVLQLTGLKTYATTTAKRPVEAQGHTAARILREAGQDLRP